MMSALVVGDLSFDVRRSTGRRTIQITVDRGGELIITAPPDVPIGAMESFVHEKRFWIYTKLAEKEAMQHAVPTREFVGGEGFPYLGRNYRLLLVNHQDPVLKLEAGRFRLTRAEAPRGREHFIAWYSEHAGPWLRRRTNQWATRFGLKAVAVEVRDLGFRWGSCSRGGKLNFHWATILLPANVIDYVIVHELAHLREAHHTPEFWLRVERAMPDFAQRKAWLAKHGAAHAAV